MLRLRHHRLRLCDHDHAESVEEQARNCLATIGKALDEGGFSLRRRGARALLHHRRGLCATVVFPILGETFGDIRPAATMIVCGLNEPEMKIEIEVTALAGRAEARMRLSHAPGLRPVWIAPCALRRLAFSKASAFRSLASIPEAFHGIEETPPPPRRRHRPRGHGRGRKADRRHEREAGQPASTPRTAWSAAAPTTRMARRSRKRTWTRRSPPTRCCSARSAGRNGTRCPTRCAPKPACCACARTWSSSPICAPPSAIRRSPRPPRSSARSSRASTS